MAKIRPTQDDVHRLFEYDADNGRLLWKPKKSTDFRDGKLSAARRCLAFNGKFANKESGYVKLGGYIFVRILGRQQMAHRLIWLYVKGEWCIEIDHINGVTGDNRIENLRPVSHAENMRNSKLPSHNTSGVVGVAFRHKKWVAQITVNRENIYLGSYSTKSDAVAARDAANLKYGFHENHGRVVTQLKADMPKE